MHQRAFGPSSLGLAASLSLLAAAACATDLPPPPPEPPAQPLVIGTSTPPSQPIAVDDAMRVPDPPPAALAPTTALAIPARDPRLARAPRARALLVAESQQLDALLNATPATSPDRGAIARRLGETFAELARASEGATAANAHKGALRSYLVVVQDAPKDPRIDEAHYYSGLEYELAGDLLNARKSYFEVIKQTPTSRFVPFAYFAFGEIFFAEAVNDPTKYLLAEQAYSEVMKYPAPANALFADARRRLAEVKQQGVGAGRVTHP